MGRINEYFEKGPSSKLKLEQIFLYLVGITEEGEGEDLLSMIELLSRIVPYNFTFNISIGCRKLSSRVFIILIIRSRSNSKMLSLL
jgi:hypothetical protein